VLIVEGKPPWKPQLYESILPMPLRAMSCGTSGQVDKPQGKANPQKSSPAITNRRSVPHPV
jgi:hypothetical protein